jgi:hypothetical protein
MRQKRNFNARVIGPLVKIKIFVRASQIGELLGSRQEYPSKSVGKQKDEFLIAALVDS